MKKIMMLAAALGLTALPAMAETLCSGESAEVKLDLATGTVRTPAATETLTYSTEWGSGDAVLSALFMVPVAEVTKGGVTTQFATLPAAFEAIGENGTGMVKLLADIDLGLNGVAYVPNGSEFTLDMNGKKIFQTEDEDLAPITYAGGTNGKLTIDDSVGGGGITVNRASSAAADKALNLHAVCCAGANGVLTVNGGTFAVTNNCGSAVIFYKEGNGTWTFNGGTYLAGSEGACSAQFLFCWGSTGKTFVTGGMYSIEAKDEAGIGIYVANEGTEQIEITDGDFDISMKKDWSPAFEFNNTCVIKGGMFDVTSLATGAIGFNVKAGALLIVSNGTFSASAANNVANCLNAMANSRIEVAGGTFSAVGGAAAGYTACSAIKGNQGSRIVITGAPVINLPTGKANDNFMVIVSGAWLDFTDYTPEYLGSIFVSNDGNTGFVKGDMSKCWWLSTSGGHFSTRPVEGKYWCADSMRPVVNLDAATKDEYPWVIGTAVAELVPESGTNYTCVADALTAASNGQTVKLITDVTENISITSAGKVNTLDLAGHVLKGADTGTAPVITINSADAAITIRDTSAKRTGAITTGGVAYEVNGAGINVLQGSLSLYDVTITNCVTSGNGGAIYQAEYANLLMSGCTVKNNTAALSGGGIYKLGGCTGSGTIETYYGKCVLHQTEVVGNTAGTSGGGVYFQKTMELSSCFVAGTRVAMADGTTKAIEEIEEGDVVKTFDHEGGTNSSARVFIWLKEAVTTRAFTLAFAGGCSVDCVLTHDFLMKDGENSCKYVRLGRANAADYVGKLFYGVDGAWHELKSVTDGEVVNEIYELYTAQHFNSYANGLLTVPADVEENLNLYKLDANLKADAEQLAADVAKYGYYSYEKAAARGVSRAYYDDSGMKYVNVIVGKGLATWEELEKIFASAQGLTSSVSASTSNVPRLTSLAAVPKLAAANAEPTLDDFTVGVLTLCAGAVVTNNTVSGAKNNIYLVSANSVAHFDSFIQLTASHDGICAGVTCEWGSGRFTTTDNVSDADVALFTSDSPAYAVKFVTDHLELVAIVTFTPMAVDHTTAAVHVDDELVEKTGGAYVITSNATATVVYTAETGYYFADGTTAKTNTIDTSVNPATAESPAAPTKPLRYVAPVYVDNIASNGIAYWTTNSVPDGYTAVESAASAVTWGTAGATSWYVVTNGTYQIDGGVACAGCVNLVLCDGAKLTVTNVANYKAGIATDASGSFTIYGTPEGAGELDVTGSDNAAGIGGGDGSEGSHIAINGGVVTAVGGTFASSIGGGSGGTGSDITINGGEVTAIGVVLSASTSAAAGIGGGNYGDGSNITINGGIVTANGGNVSAGIGGGSDGSGSNITVNGGEVTARGGAFGAGIGGGYSGNGSNIAINGGMVTAIGGPAGAGIGGGMQGTGSNVKIANAVVSVQASALYAEAEYYVAEFVGNGVFAADEAAGNEIDASADVLFNLTGISDGEDGWIEEPAPMPESFEGFVIMTPETQTLDRVLVGGISTLGLQPSTFSLTNAVSGATSEITVNGADVVFAGKLLSLPHANDKLTLTAVNYSSIVPRPVANTTFEIYTNDVSIGVGKSSITVEQNTPAYVVYTADADYYFSEGVSVVTNTCDTSVNPATLSAPNAPGKIISDIPSKKQGQIVIVPVEKPTETEEKTWEKATNIVASVQTAAAEAILTDNDFTNAVNAAKLQTEKQAGKQLVSAIADVNIVFSPSNVVVDVAGDIRAVSMDVTPILTSRAVVEDTATGTITTNEVADWSKVVSEYSGKPMTLSFNISTNLAADPMLIVHTHGGQKYNYVRGNTASESTFVYDAATKTVYLQMSTFSELEIYSDIQVGDSAYARIVDGVCTITGSGDMWDKAQWPDKTNPLAAYKKAITSVVVEDGVTSVGQSIFYKFYAIRDVSVAASVTRVAAHAFYNCHSIENIAFAGATPTLGEQAIKYTAAIRMNGSIPEVYTIPEVTSASRKVWAKNALTDKDWIDATDMTDAERGAYHFFKVELK